MGKREEIHDEGDMVVACPIFVPIALHVEKGRCQKESSVEEKLAVRRRRASWNLKLNRPLRAQHTARSGKAIHTRRAVQTRRTDENIQPDWVSLCFKRSNRPSTVSSRRLLLLQLRRYEDNNFIWKKLALT